MSRRGSRQVRVGVEQLECRVNPSAPMAATSFFDSAVYEFDSLSGALKGTLVAPYSSSLLSGPAGLTVGPDGNLYISSQFNNAILQYNLASNTLTTFIAPAVLQPIATANGDTQFAPAGLRFGQDGNLYVSLNAGQSASSGGAIIRFNISSGAGGLSYAGTSAAVATGLIQPTSLAFGTATGDTDSLYVSNSAADNVVKVAKALSATPTSATFIASASGGLNYPAGLSWGADGKLYVVDLGATSFQGNVLQFNADGSFSKVMTPTGSGQPGNLQFQFPSDVLFDGQGHFLTGNLGSSQPPNLQGSINQYNTDGTFVQTLVASSQFPNTGQGKSGIAPSQLALLPVNPLAATHFQVIAPATATVGSPVTVTVTALDQNNNPAGSGYTGTVKFSSTDAAAGLPANGTLTNGTGTFSVTFNSPGNQTVSATDTVFPGITGASGPVVVSAIASQFAVVVPSTATAGSGFLVTVTAQDGGGHTATGYSGTVHLTSTDSQAVLPPDAKLTNGVGGFLVTLKTVAGSPWTITAKDTLQPAIAGTSPGISVTPGPASYFTVLAPTGRQTTGTPFSVTVTAFDEFGNVATTYSGHVHFTSNDPSAVLPVDSTLTSGQSVFSVTLMTAGKQTITATDTVSTAPTITGTSDIITARGLIVTSFTPTPTGFAATFSKPFVPADLTLYGPNLKTIQDVTLFGARVGAITGSLILDPLDMGITFNATANALSLMNGFGSVVLADDTYTATLVSGSRGNGFLDALGAPLDGKDRAGHGDYVATFSTNYQTNATPVLGIPDFARGPDDAHAVKVPNDSAHGIPITLYNASKVTDVTFTLVFNPSLFNLSAGSNGDATDPSSTLTLVAVSVNIDGTRATASFHYQGSTAQSGTVVLGDLVATVPNTAAAKYKAKQLLQLGAVAINQGAATAVAANGIEVNTYFGDVTGNGTIDGLDVATANTVARGTATGFPAFQLVDPAVVGDVALDNSVDAGDVSDLAAFTVHLPMPVIPPIPTGLTITPAGADPTLSLGQPQREGDTVTMRPGESSLLTVPVLLDHPHPDGSSGMTEAVLALAYDPALLSVSAADITLGSIPGLGWQLSSVVDQAAGQIGIELYSTTPITTNQAGSLVNIAFHIQPGVSPPVSVGPPWAAVQLVGTVTPGGQPFTTQVDDAQGQFVLSPGMDRLLLPIVGTAAVSKDNAPTPAAITLRAKADSMAPDASNDLSASFALDSLANDVLAVVDNAAAGAERAGVPAGLIVSGALAFQTNDLSVASAQLAGQMFQIGNALWINAGRTDFQSFRGKPDGLEIRPTKTDTAADLASDSIWESTIVNQDWLAMPAQSLVMAAPADSAAGTPECRPVGAQSVSSRWAVVDEVFAQVMDEMEDFGD